MPSQVLEDIKKELQQCEKDNSFSAIGAYVSLDQASDADLLVSWGRVAKQQHEHGGQGVARGNSLAAPRPELGRHSNTIQYTGTD